MRDDGNSNFKNPRRNSLSHEKRRPAGDLIQGPLNDRSQRRYFKDDNELRS